MIRVLRVLEYTYDSPKAMQEDMDRWTRAQSHTYMTMRTVGELVTHDNTPPQPQPSTRYGEGSPPNPRSQPTSPPSWSWSTSGTGER